MLKKILIAITFLLISVLTYYVMVVIEARNSTAGIVQVALSSGRMQLNLKDLSSEQLEALLKVEDPNFYHHTGFDFSTPGAGSTTISQALVKIYYFNNFKPGWQKIEQTLIARFAFDKQVPKDTILKLFINEVYLGEDGGQPIRGFEQASNRYFGKSFKAITWDEYLAIVAMILAPSTYNCIEHKEANAGRVTKIKKMLNGEYLPKDNSDLLYDRE